MSRNEDVMKLRKDEHIIASVLRDVESSTTLLDKVYLVHDSLPEINMEEVSTEVEIFRKRLNMPLIIGALTGGTELAYKVNKLLAQIAEKFKIGICVGSQRIAIENPSARSSFEIVREAASSTLKIANIGAPQLSSLDEKTLLDWCITAVDMIDADALTIHLNPLQECLQPEGEPNYRSVLDKIRYLVKNLDVPIIVKEVGFGISKETASKLSSCNVAGIEIAGFGGTNFVLIEKFRAESSLDLEELKVYETFKNFGIPTVLSLCEVLEVFNGIIIASGGVRTGLDIAKLLALGAHMTAIARPFLELALEGQERVERYVLRLHRELKIAMFMTGARRVEELREKPIVVHQDILTWLVQRGLSKCLKRVCGDKILEMMRCT